MKYPKSNKYDKQLVHDNMMGPNSLKFIEELTSHLNLEPSMKILDLGCGISLL